MAQEHARRFNLLVMYRAGKSFTFDPVHLSSHEGSPWAPLDDGGTS